MQHGHRTFESAQPDVDMSSGNLRSPDFDSLDLKPSLSKHLLEGIVKLEDLNEWPRFISEVRMMLDGAFPFAGVFFRAAASLDEPPTTAWLGDLPDTCETTMDTICCFFP